MSHNHKNEFPAANTVSSFRQSGTPGYIKNWLCTGRFGDEMLKDFMKFYTDLQKDKETDAIIYIDSYGGQVTTANSIISVIEHSHINFHTCVIGAAYSSGLALCVAGKKRFATRRARFLFHDITFGAVGKVDEMMELAQESKDLSKRFLGELAGRTKKPVEWWLSQTKKKETRDFVFDAAKAVRLGVADKIGLPELITTRKVS